MPSFPGLDDADFVSLLGKTHGRHAAAESGTNDNIIKIKIALTHIYTHCAPPNTEEIESAGPVRDSRLPNTASKQALETPDIKMADTVLHKK